MPTLMGTFHQGDSSCVFQKGTKCSLGKEELRSPESFLFFCGPWKCSKTKTDFSLVACYKRSPVAFAQSQTPVGEEPFAAIPGEGHSAGTVLQNLPDSCKLHLFHKSSSLEAKKENVTLRGKRAAGHSPQTRRLLKSMASHGDCLGSNNRETDQEGV